MQKQIQAQDVHNAIVLRLSVAIELNAEMPLPGLSEALYATRADEGPDVFVCICTDCQTVEVVR